MGGEGSSVESQRPRGFLLAVMVMGGFIVVCIILGYFFVLHGPYNIWLSGADTGKLPERPITSKSVK